jgi:hypothetical protein
MVLGVGIAVAMLYSGVDDGDQYGGNSVPDQGRYLLLPAIPSDAMAVCCFTQAEAGMSGLLKGFEFPAVLADSMAAGKFNRFSSSRLSVSLHYSGDVEALYVFDAGKSSSEPSADAAALMAFMRGRKMTVEFVDGSSSGTDRDILKHSLIVASDSDLLVKSAVRHLQKGISVMESSGFSEAASSVEGGDVIFFSNSHARMLIPAMLARKYAGNDSFVADFAQWTSVSLAKFDASGIYAGISAVYEKDGSDFMDVLCGLQPSVSEISHMLPSYTVSAVTLPMKSVQQYMTEYNGYLDSRQVLHLVKSRQKRLAEKTGIRPEDFVKRLDVKEVAKADFLVGKGLESVNLIKIGRQDTLIFVGTDNKSFETAQSSIHVWPYASYLSTVFGKLFELKDESCFTYMNGWVISGSLDAVKHYVEGYALEYTLAQYMADAGQKDLFAQPSVLTACFTPTAYPDGNKDFFRTPVLKAVEKLCADADYCPMIFTASKDKRGGTLKFQMPRLELLKTRAPGHERDTVVVIPQGPFRVKNSGTGKMNLFYQNSHGSICLQEEGGKGLWGVPFKGKLCGTAQTLDYYANGKLQILFGSGSSIYLIDRLGHYVNGFPTDLGKTILLGPDVYDFNGTNAYNIMVLHKDNTIEMYNLKGVRPSSWKTIVAPETVKALPERIMVGGNTFWLVRTSIQTLIYPFGGGNALTSFKGDQMIRPDSEVRVVDAVSVSVDCYDGVARTVTLK